MSASTPEPSAPAEGRKRGNLERIKHFFREHPGGVIAALCAVVAVGVGGLLWLRYLGSFEGTDDAQVDGDVSTIASRIAGTVTNVRVEDNDRVQQGDVLVDLDPADYRVALDQAEAKLTQAQSEARGQRREVPITKVTNRTTVSTARQDVATARADLDAARNDREAAVARQRQSAADERLASLNLQRSRHLLETQAVSQQDLDEHQAAADASSADVVAARASVEASRSRVEQSAAKLEQALARMRQAEQNSPKELERAEQDVSAREAATAAARAAVEQASLDLSYVRVAAPVTGIVGQKSVNIGDRVLTAQALMAIVQVNRLWITANYKETQLEHMRPGQRADVHVDALGRSFHGRVESLPGATGARFSLLPPENATGNYVKIVQRLPVRISLDPDQPGLDRLRPGMSAEPTVWLR